MSAQEDFAKAGGDALEIDEDEFSDEGDEQEQFQKGPDPNDDDEPPRQTDKAGSGAKGKDDQVENQHFDMAFEVNESDGDEIDSGEEEDIVADQ